MNVDIKYEGDIYLQVSNDLIELADLITEECGVSVAQKKTKPESGAKDSGLTIGLAIAGLALTGVQTAISAVQYWKSEHPKYLLSIYSGGETYILDNTNKEEVDRIFKIISLLPTDIIENIEIKISRK
ncbi:hypothetical protein [Anabaena catenula]|uniref:Uncharacterized protein n=1 Tax=Anabaena catenula FACHB-362 TaxID=2692877 RepID=A0ABR8J238_9NOST|nr:hypothetical protein [Anabaena catenula]MBD2691572.1 hypothetical protein [Anabaena catenula FACHB-362]